MRGLASQDDFPGAQAAQISLAFPLISAPAPGPRGAPGLTWLSALLGSICSPGAYFLHHLAECPVGKQTPCGPRRGEEERLRVELT